MSSTLYWALIVALVALISTNYVACDATFSISANPNASDSTKRSLGTKCNPKSVSLARHSIASELNYINQFSSIWFNDLTEDELSERQKQSLASIVMSNGGSQLLNAEGLPLVEVETSYFRPLDLDRIPMGQIANNTLFSRLMQLKQSSYTRSIPISIDLIRQYPNQRCYKTNDGGTSAKRFVLVFGVSVGPFEHLMDVVYNIPSKLRYSQPIDWHRAQVSLIVHQLSYEIVLHQSADYKLSAGKCPIQVTDITYVGPTNMRPDLASTYKSPVAIGASGMAINNHTTALLERLFDDYTRPAISARLRQLFEFYLNSKQLPLSGLD